MADPLSEAWIRRMLESAYLDKMETKELDRIAKHVRYVTTPTGRMPSQSPAMQNIPMSYKSTMTAKNIKGSFMEIVGDPTLEEYEIKVTYNTDKIRLRRKNAPWGDGDG